MAKAADDLQPTMTTINRRRSEALPAPAGTLRAEPSARGRAILDLIAEQRAAMAEQGKRDEAGDKAGAKRCERRCLAIAGRIERLARAIMASPITSLSDVADRAIAAAYDCDAIGGKLVPREDGKLIGRLVSDLLAMSGLSPRQAHFAI